MLTSINTATLPKIKRAQTVPALHDPHFEHEQLLSQKVPTTQQRSHKHSVMGECTGVIHDQCVGDVPC